MAKDKHKCLERVKLKVKVSSFHNSHARIELQLTRTVKLLFCGDSYAAHRLCSNCHQAMS